MSPLIAAYTDMAEVVSSKTGRMPFGNHKASPEKPIFYFESCVILTFLLSLPVIHIMTLHKACGIAF